MKKAFIIIAIAASMSSCGIYTQYQHPESIMPEGLYRDIEPHDTTSLASLSWKELLADSYYTLLMLDKQLSISNETLHNWTENVRIMNALKTAGRTNESAVAQAEANKLVVESAVLRLQRQIKEVENSLSVLLGMAPQFIDRTSLDEQNFPSKPASGVPLQLLSNRPDIQQAEYTLAQFFYATNKTRAAFYPGISLSGSAGWTNNAGGIILNPGQLLLNAIGSLVQPIFNRGTNRAKLKIAKAQQEEALQTFRQSLLNAGAEVNNALSQWQTARQQLVLSDRQIHSLQTAVHSTRLMMQHGNTNYLEVLTAQQTLLNAELAVAEYKFWEIQGVISLYHALGGGTY